MKFTALNLSPQQQVEAALGLVAMQAHLFWDNYSQVLRATYGRDFDGCAYCREVIAMPHEITEITPTSYMVHRQAAFGLKVDILGAMDLEGFLQGMSLSQCEDDLTLGKLRRDWSKLHAHASWHPSRVDIAWWYNDLTTLNSETQDKVLELKSHAKHVFGEIGNDVCAGQYSAALTLAIGLIAKLEVAFEAIIGSYSRHLALQPH